MHKHPSKNSLTRFIFQCDCFYITNKRLQSTTLNIEEGSENLTSYKLVTRLSRKTPNFKQRS